MGKSFLAALFISLLLLGYSYGEPQVSLLLGKTVLSGGEFKFPVNTAALNYTFNPYSRLQFGLEYESNSAIVNKRTFYNCSGILFTTRLLFETMTNKTPYIGFNAGALNTSLADNKIIYSARGSSTGESIAGYSFRLDELSRFNIEYRNRYVWLNIDQKILQRSETIAFCYSFLLVADESANIDRSLGKEEGLNAKRDYLEKRVQSNTSLIDNYDLLINKYNQKIADSGPDDQTIKERDFLVRQKAELEEKNKQLKQTLEL